MAISEETRRTADELVRRYPVARSALLPLLHLLQSEHGYVTEEAVAFCAERLGLTKAEVGAVSTFYTMFKREPVGDWLISICTNPTCKYAGAEDIYRRFQDKLGGHHDEESGVSVEHAECLGICDAAPVIQVNYEMYGPLPDDQVDALLDGCMKGDPPASNWSGEKPKRFREVEYELSGAGDGWGARLGQAAREMVEADVPPSYRTGETDLPVTHPGGDPKGVGGQVLRERLGVAGGADRPAERDGSTHGAEGVAGGADRPAERDGSTHGAEGGQAERGGADDEAHLRPEPDETAPAREAEAAVDGTGSGVAEERADHAEGTGAAPATQDQPDVAEEGDVAAAGSAEGQVDATEEGVTESPQREATEEDAGEVTVPDEVQSDDTLGQQPNLESSEDASQTEEEER